MTAHSAATVEIAPNPNGENVKTPTVSALLYFSEKIGAVHMQSVKQYHTMINIKNACM